MAEAAAEQGKKIPAVQSRAEMANMVVMLRIKRSYRLGSIASRPTSRARTTVAAAMLTIWPNSRMVATVPEARP